MSSTLSASRGVPGASHDASLLASRGLRIALWALLLGGVLARLSPFADVGGRMYWQWMSEDGYLMQTVARNMAIGLGMSVAEGTIPTNGVQPLATFAYAAMHWLAGGDKLAGIEAVTLLSALVSVAAAWLMFRVAARVMATRPHGRELALVCAVLWFASLRIISHSSNGLETGIYYLALLAALAYYLRITADEQQALGWAQRLALGCLLGIAFLARNDAVFFISGLLAAHALAGGRDAGGGWARRVVDALVASAVSLFVALPWLVNNYALFGTIVPISGIAESHSAALGQNLMRLPATLFEAASLFVPVPRAIEGSTLVALLSLAIVLASLGGFWWLAARASLAARRFFLAGLIFLGAIGGYYGLFFGAAHFLARYTSPLSIFLWVCTCTCGFAILSAVLRTPRQLAAGVLAVMSLLGLACAVWVASVYAKGTTGMHKQVVDWVTAHVPESAWVGAVQTGTLGYFHDRAINLDGKVNPAALRAKLAQGHVLDYVVDSKIDYLADWVGIGTWASLAARSPRFAEQFELIVSDEKKNLAVLRRKQPSEGPTGAQ